MAADAVKRLIDETVEVGFMGGAGSPTSFSWRGREYRITEVHGSSATVDFRRPWYRRRHRERYRVTVDTGQIFELYFHRGPGRKYWVLSREL